MRLIPITADDEALAVRLECEPDMTQHLGGPRPEADVRAAHRRRLALMEQGAAQMFKIVSDDAREALAGETLGTVGIWEIDWKGPQAYEMGWLVLPEHQGKGVASEAARLILEKARSNPEIRFVYAFPAVSNVASNAVARKIGMSSQGAFDYEGFAGVLRCSEWCIDLGQPA